MFRACSQGFWSTACHIPFPRFYNFFNYLFVNLLCEYQRPIKMCLQPSSGGFNTCKTVNCICSHQISQSLRQHQYMGQTVVHALVQASSHSLSIRCENLVIQPAMSVARSKDYFHHDPTKFVSGFSKLNMFVSVPKNACRWLYPLVI